MTDKPHVIECMYVVLATDKETGDEGVCGMLTDNGWVPLVASDRIRLAKITETAKALARQNQMLVRVVRFDTRTEIEVIDGRQ